VLDLAQHRSPGPGHRRPLPARRPQGGTHCNNIEVLPDGRWLLSFRLTSTLAIVEPATGEIVWRWKGETSHQHDARPVGDGHILMFDNGCHRPGLPSFSRVIEIDLETEAIVWQHQAEVVLSLFSYMGSGAQRLAGGNTLITECATGRIIEVTADHRVVWEYVCPFQHTSAFFGPTPMIGNAERLPLEDPRLDGRDLDPARYEVLNERLRTGTRLPPDDFGL
jgi:hypothetical protein